MTRTLKATLSVVATIRVGWVKPLFTTFFTFKLIHRPVLFIYTKSINFFWFVNLSHLVISTYVTNVSVVRIMAMYFESETVAWVSVVIFRITAYFCMAKVLCTINMEITGNRSINCIESLNWSSRSHPDSKSTIVQMFYFLRYPVVCSISFVWQAVVQLLGIFLTFDGIQKAIWVTRVIRSSPKMSNTLYSIDLC